MDELADRVGHGHLVGKVEVNQVYAHYQHEGLDLRHPRGGHAKYLEQPMIGGAEDHMRTLAKNTLDVEGPRRGMQDVVENVSRSVHEEAPREFEDLRNSAHPTVASDDTVIYDRPPLVHRLTDDELREKNRLRNLGVHSYPLDHPQHVTNRLPGH
jgi:hypothetical protein